MAKSGVPIDRIPPTAAARHNDDHNVASTSAVNSSSSYTRAPAENSTSNKPHSPAPTSPCPSNTKPDADEGDESSVFCEGHVRWMQRSQEERQGVYFVLEESQTQTGAFAGFHSCDLLTGGIFMACRGKDRPPPNRNPFYST